MLPNILKVFDTLSKQFFVPFFSLLRFQCAHYGPFPLFCILTLCRLVVIAFQRVRWRRNGLLKQLDRIYQGLDYEISAQVMNVRWGQAAFTVDKVRAMNYLATHDTLTHPRYVMADDCMLAEVTLDYALFVQLKKPLTEYSARTVTFLWAAIPYETRKIIIMPITSMQQLATEIGPPKDGGAHVTFLWGSGRCGSTLITKIISAADPDALALSEPPVMMDLYSYMRILRPGDCQRFVESAIRLLVKPLKARKKLFIKPIFFTLEVSEYVHNTVPNARMLYLYRKPLRTIWAHERAFTRIVFYRAMHSILLTNEWEWGQRLIGFHRNPPIDKVSRHVLGKGSFDLCCIIWADNYMIYQQLAKLFNFPAIIYDRLFDNPHQFCAEILSYCGVDSSRIEQALDVIMNGDSQDGSVLGQSSIRGLAVTPFTAELKARTDRFCDALNLPRLEHEGGSRQNPFAHLSTPSSRRSAPNQTTADDGPPNENAGGDNNTFITSPDQLIHEIMHAGTASGQWMISKSRNKQQEGSAEPKKMRPYYKPLPLQLIFSQD